MDNYYKLLGLPEYCSDQEQIKSAYRKMVKYYHPDSKNVTPEIAEEQTKKINVAYDVLSDPSKKQQYDQQLRFGATNPNQNYTNSYTNANNYYQRPNNDDFFRFTGFGFPFGPGFFYSSGPRTRRSGGFLRIIILYLILSFLLRSCFGGFGYRYYYYPYDDYREEPSQENADKGSVCIDYYEYM